MFEYIKNVFSAAKLLNMNFPEGRYIPKRSMVVKNKKRKAKKYSKKRGWAHGSKRDYRNIKKFWM